MFKRVALAAGLVAPLLAQAAVDTSAITGAATDIAAIGLAAFGIHVGVKLWKWFRSAT